MIFEIRERRDRQTHRHTDTLIAVIGTLHPFWGRRYNRNIKCREVSLTYAGECRFASEELALDVLREEERAEVAFLV